MRQINFGMIRHRPGEIANLHATGDGPLHRRRMSDAHLIGADNAHLGQAQAVGVMTKQFPTAHLQIAHRQRKRFRAVNQFAQTNEKDLARRPEIWIGSME